MKNRWIVFLLFCITFIPGLVYPQGTLTQILNNGANDKRLNIVFLSEGYTSTETSDFSTDAATMLNYLLSESPYNVYSNYFNAYTIFIASNESGSDHPLRSDSVDTYFNSTYDSWDLPRLITIPPNDYDPDYNNGIGKVYNLLQIHIPYYDLVVMIVNDDEYGGSGSSFAIISVNPLSRDIGVHEIGHSFAKLVDEYEDPYPSHIPYEEPNSTQETRRAFIKWNHWILDQTPIPTPETAGYTNVVGIFEGCQYQATGWYRPKFNCLMRAFDVPFCEVCKENHIKSIYNILSPVENFFPDTSASIAMTGEDSSDFIINPMKPSFHSLSISWIVNGDTLGETADTLSLYGDSLQMGQNTLEAFVADGTSLVRDTTIHPLLEDRIIWTIDYTPTSHVDDSQNAPTRFTLHQNYPNPFNPATTICYSIQKSEFVQISIYDTRGKLIETLICEKKDPGYYSAKWHAENIASGVYFIRLTTGKFISMRKCLLIK